MGSSSVRVGARGEVSNREFGGGPGYYGRGLHSSRVQSGTDEIKWGNARDTVGGEHNIGGTLDIDGAGVVGYGIGSTSS